MDAWGNELWWAQRWRTVLALLAGGGGFISVVACWMGVSGSLVVANQLSYIASGGLIGLFLLGVATLLFWSEQRDRELERLHRVETYLAAIAVALDLVDADSVSQDQLAVMGVDGEQLLVSGDLR